MNPSPFTGVQIADIGHAVQLAIAPVFLIAGIGALLNVMANRLGRVVDRARALERDITGYDETMRARAMAELVVLDRRMVLVHWAIYACVSSALAVCLVIGVLFVGDLADAAVGTIVAALFIAAMALIVAGLVIFLIETGIATRSVRVRQEILKREVE
ncbi:DUF2721 domain-containing protein [Sphingosinicella soli]|uniref:DUF2721 domain-containing protein n=1 Tax=Sphingosinicella soli TaxID=333708 RepID=A0A7W7B1K3_9SPHN|nr:DUF2721 domain-containing protein [Sphingosinicella soli]MBB4631322.1 hypothetical protein [Sphingosinicella soli]